MNASSRTANSLRNLFTGIGGQLLTTVLKFITRTIFIYTLGKAYLGISGLFSNILSLLSLTELGFDTAITFRLYKPLAEHDFKRVRLLMKFFRQVYMVIGAVIFLLGLCLIPCLRFLIKDYDSLGGLEINAVLIFLLYLSQSASSYMFFAYRSAVIKADQKQYILNLSGFAITAVTEVAQIIILLNWHNFILYTVTYFAFCVVNNLVNAVIAKRMYPEVFQNEPDGIGRDEIRELYKDCGALFFHRVNDVVIVATDNMVLSTFLGLAVVGVYSNYRMIFDTINQFLANFYSATMASMGNLYAESEVEKRYRFFQIMNYITTVFYGTACVGIAVVADELLECWIGSDYVFAKPFAVWLGINILFNGLKRNLSQIRNISGTFRQAWLRPVLGIVINIGVSIGLVQICGAYGVIVGTVCAYLFTNILVDPFVIHRYSFCNYRPVSEYYKKNLGYLVLLFLVGAADMLLCKTILPGYGWLSVAVHILICGLSVPVAFLLCYWNTAECRYLRDKFLKRRGTKH